MPDQFPYDVLLSHSAKDKAVVRALAERLPKDGLKVWFDEWVFKAGDSIPAKIEKRLEHSQFGFQPSGFSISLTPPSKAPLHNSFTSTGDQKHETRNCPN